MSSRQTMTKLLALKLKSRSKRLRLIKETVWSRQRRIKLSLKVPKRLSTLNVFTTRNSKSRNASMRRKCTTIMSAIKNSSTRRKSRRRDSDRRSQSFTYFKKSSIKS